MIFPIRDKFDPKGRVVARKPVTLTKRYEAGEEVAEEHVPRDQPRLLFRLWDLALIDTPPKIEKKK